MTDQSYYTPFGDNEREEVQPIVVEGWTLLDNDMAAKINHGALILRRYITDGPDENGDPVYSLGQFVAGIEPEGFATLRSLITVEE